MSLSADTALGMFWFMATDMSDFRDEQAFAPMLPVVVPVFENKTFFECNWYVFS